MFNFALSFQQAFPQFLDFVFPFGRQLGPQEYLCSGFQEESSIAGDYEALTIPELGRSGKEIRMCYTLKSTEPITTDVKMPWSMRQMAVFHSFDTELGHAEWIIVKGNKLIQDRIASVETTLGFPDWESTNKIEDAVVSTVRVHLLLCNWSIENWRWYLKFLEEEFQAYSERTLDVFVGDPPRESPRLFPENPHSVSVIAPVHPMKRGFKSFFHQLLTSLHPRPIIHRNTKRTSHAVSEDASKTSFTPPSQQDCSFADLQRAQYIGEKVNEASVVIQANAAVVARLKKYYFSDDSAEYLGYRLVRAPGLCKRLQACEIDLGLQQLRAEALSKLIAERKSLVQSTIWHPEKIYADLSLALDHP